MHREEVHRGGPSLLENARNYPPYGNKITFQTSYYARKPLDSSNYLLNSDLISFIVECIELGMIGQAQDEVIWIGILNLPIVHDRIGIIVQIVN